MKNFLNKPLKSIVLFLCITSVVLLLVTQERITWLMRLILLSAYALYLVGQMTPLNKYLHWIFSFVFCVVLAIFTSYLSSPIVGVSFIVTLLFLTVSIFFALSVRLARTITVLFTVLFIFLSGVVANVTRIGNPFIYLGIEGILLSLLGIYFLLKREN